jgi:hypothetical protein
LDLCCTLVTWPPSSLLLNSFLPHLKQFKEDSQLFLIGMKYINHIPSPYSPSFTLPTHIRTLPNTVLILQSWFLLLIFKLMLQGVSQRITVVVVLYIGPFNPFHYSPLSLYLLHPIFQQHSVHILISSTFTSCGMRY